MDQELEKLIQDYVKEIEHREQDLSSFNNEIKIIIHDADKDLDQSISDLDTKFDNNQITEEEYLDLLRKEKQTLLQKTKEKLDTLIEKIKETNNT